MDIGLWLLSHEVVFVGEWMRSRGGEAGCKLCGHALESIPHYIWNCEEAINIWGRSLTIMANCGVKGNVEWGSL